MFLWRKQPREVTTCACSLWPVHWTKEKRCSRGKNTYVCLCHDGTLVSLGAGQPRSKCQPICQSFAEGVLIPFKRRRYPCCGHVQRVATGGQNTSRESGPFPPPCFLSQALGPPGCPAGMGFSAASVRSLLWMQRRAPPPCSPEWKPQARAHNSRQHMPNTSWDACVHRQGFLRGGLLAPCGGGQNFKLGMRKADVCLGRLQCLWPWAREVLSAKKKKWLISVVLSTSRWNSRMSFLWCLLPLPGVWTTRQQLLGFAADREPGDCPLTLGISMASECAQLWSRGSAMVAVHHIPMARIPGRWLGITTLNMNCDLS